MASLSTNIPSLKKNVSQSHTYSDFSKSVLKRKKTKKTIVDVDQSVSRKRRFRCHRPPILHPFGPMRCGWDMLVMVLLVYTCMEVPVTLAFNISLTLAHFTGVISLTIDCLLLTDILVTFRSAYFDVWDKLSLVRDQTMICKRYLRGWFFIDFFTSLPFEFMLPPSSAGEVVKMFRILRFIRIIKMLRLIKMMKVFDGFISRFVVREFLIFLKFLKVFAFMLICTHLSACVWFFVGYTTMSSTTDSWITSKWPEANGSHSAIDEISTFTKYTYSWYWAVVTLFTTGYGDITATKGNIVEHWVATMVVLSGTCCVAYFIGNVTSLITEGDRIQSVKMQKLEEAQAFIDQKRLPRDLSRAILTHIRYHCRHNYVFDEGDLISSLPPNLQNQIHSRFANSILSQLDFFQSFTKTPNSLQCLGQISLKMKSISCNEGFRLFSKGDRAKEIYIQRTGEAVIDFHDGSSQLLYRGDVVGEHSISSAKRKYTVTCATFSEFYILPISEIIGVLQAEYPTTWTRRWKNVVADLRDSQQRNGAKWIRTLNFHENEGETVTGDVDTEVIIAKVATESADVDVASTDLARKDSTDDLTSKEPLNPKMTTDDMARLGSAGSLRESRSLPKPKGTMRRAKLTKKSTLHSIFHRRNSLDRDDAIHRSARKRGSSTPTAHRMPSSPMDSRTTDAATPRDMSPGPDGDSLSSSDGMGDLVPGLDLEDDDSGIKRVGTEFENNEDITGALGMAVSGRSAGMSGGGRKGGKFGGKRRGGAKGTKSKSGLPGKGMKGRVVTRAAATRKSNYNHDRGKANRLNGDREKDDSYDGGTKIVLQDSGGTEMTAFTIQSASDSLGPEPEPDVTNGFNANDSSIEAMMMSSLNLSTIKSKDVKFKDSEDNLPSYEHVANGATESQISNTFEVD